MLSHEQPSRTENISNFKFVLSPRKRRSADNLDLYTPSDNASYLTRLGYQARPKCSTPADKCDGKFSQQYSKDFDGYYYCVGCEVSCNSVILGLKSLNTVRSDQAKSQPVDNNITTTNIESDPVLLKENGTETPDWAKWLMEEVDLYHNRMKSS